MPAIPICLYTRKQGSAVKGWHLDTNECHYTTAAVLNVALSIHDNSQAEK